MADQKPRAGAPDAIAAVVESLRGKGGMSFCGGLGVLFVQVPPHLSTWLAGDLSPWREGLWIAAATAVIAGIVWLGFTLAGRKAPKAVTETATGKSEG